MHEKDTDDLFEELKILPDAKNFIKQNQNEFKLQFNEYLTKLLDEKLLQKSEVVNRINKDDKHIYHIFAGTAALQFCTRVIFGTQL